MSDIDWTAIGTIALALITAVYVILTYKVMGETRRMAASTRDLAESSLRPDLVICRPHHQVAYGPETSSWQAVTRSRVINQGAGPAFSVSIHIDGSDFHVANVLPREGIAYHPELANAKTRHQDVTVHYKDGMGKAYETSWVYEDEIKNWRAERQDENGTP